MAKGVWSIMLALFLAACGADVPADDAAGAGSDTNAAEVTTVPVMGPERNILAFGDSLFAGYNVAKEASYPARLEAALRARGINAQVANVGISGDTSAAGLQRLTFTLDAQTEKPDLFILELGLHILLDLFSFLHHVGVLLDRKFVSFGRLDSLHFLCAVLLDELNHLIEDLLGLHIIVC